MRKAFSSLRALRTQVPRLTGVAALGRSNLISSVLLPSLAATALTFRGFHSTFPRSAQIAYPASEVAIGKPAPTFSAPAVVDGEIKNVSLEEYRGKWVILLFYPKDFTFVCPTEIIAFSDKQPEFSKLNTQVLALSTDTEEVHLAWIRTARRKGGLGHMQIPVVADTTKAISARYGVLLEDAGIALRGLFIIDPNGVLQQITVNNLPVGRSVDEAIRLVQAFQFVAEHGEVCPANWKPGAKTMIADPDKSLAYFESGATEAEEDTFSDMGANVRIIKTPKDYHDLVASGKVVVDFYAPWCGKCRQIAPHFKQLADQYASKGIKFASFDTNSDALSGLAQQLGVQTLPAFRFLKDGKQAVEGVLGYKKRPLAEAVEQLSKK